MSIDTAFSIERTLNPADFEICSRMMVASDPWISLGMDQALCLLAFEGDFREVYILKLNHEICGFLILQIKGSFKGYIQTLCIHEMHRGKNLGTFLLEFAEQQILTYSPNMFICVSSFNEAAIRLYKKFGFQFVGVLDSFLKDGFSEYLFRKTVGPILGYTGKQNLHD